jgi:hypothetical protein
MRLTSTPPDAGWSDLVKLTIAASFVAVVAFLWKLIRPLGGRVIFYFIEHPDMRTYFQKYMDDTVPKLAATIAMTSSAVRTLQDTVADIARTQHDQHKINVDANQENRVELEKIAGKMDSVTAALGRIEGREEARYNSNRRRGDPR